MPTMVYTAITARMGADRGRYTFSKTWYTLAPSIFAASRRVSGMVPKKDFTRIMFQME